MTTTPTVGGKWRCSDYTCHDRVDYLERAREITRWITEEQKGVSV